MVYLKPLPLLLGGPQLLPQARQLLLFGLQSGLLLHAAGLEVQDNQVAAHQIEAAQVLARVLGVVNVLVDDVGGAARIVGVPAGISIQNQFANQ